MMHRLRAHIALALLLSSVTVSGATAAHCGELFDPADDTAFAYTTLTPDEAQAQSTDVRSVRFGRSANLLEVSISLQGSIVQPASGEAVSYWAFWAPRPDDRELADTLGVRALLVDDRWTFRFGRQAWRFPDGPDLLEVDGQVDAQDGTITFSVPMDAVLDGVQDDTLWRVGAYSYRATWIETDLVDDRAAHSFSRIWDWVNWGPDSTPERRHDVDLQSCAPDGV